MQLKILYLSTCLFCFVNSLKSEVINENVSIKWRTWNGSITFHIAAKTHGWVAIGFNQEPQMKGADIVLAGLANHSGYVYDMHDSKGHARPTPDTHQNYKLIWAQENGTHTFVTIRRPFNTSDADDFVITDQPISLIWAFHANDAKSDKDFDYHGPNRGAEKVTLLTTNVEMKWTNKKSDKADNVPKN